MATKNAGYKKLTGAEQRALAQQLAPTAAPSEATVREASFLRNITGAGDDLEWILLNQAWTQLDFERVGDWWEQRVLPVLDKLDLRPSASLAERVIAAIEADEQVLPKAQRRTQREIASIAKTSQSRVSRLLADSRESGSDLGETSAAGPAANPEGDSPVLGEPVGVDEQASTGTQSPPAADASTTLPHAGVPAVGDQIEERDEEEAAEASADLPAAATTSLPDGDGNPLPEQSQQPGQDSPPVLGSEGFPGRAETDHQQVARVSPAGVAPGSGSGPQYADPVEPVELEDGDAAVTPSSSDPDEEEEATPTDLLFRLFGALMTLIDHVDAEAVGPLLLLAEVEQLHQHVDVLTAFVAKVSMAQFQASQRTP